MVNINSLKELEIFVKNYVKNIGRSSILGLIGDLGAGKTQFVKFIVKYLGGEINTVSSPTFTIINEYFIKDKCKIYHFDLYRLKSIEELEEIGYEEYFFGDNICIVEWIDNIPECIDYVTNLIKIEYINENSRKITILK